MAILLEIQVFIEQGGVVIWAVFVTCLLLWTCMIERLWFYQWVFPTIAHDIAAQWAGRADKKSWRARSLREMLLSQAALKLRHRLNVIKVLIILCPMLGLLGTVTGMIQVFDVIAFTGASDAKAMAQGVYQATIPTMAGLVVALSGYYLSARLYLVAERHSFLLSEQLSLS